jgi:hypothetical protein
LIRHGRQRRRHARNDVLEHVASFAHAPPSPRRDGARSGGIRVQMFVSDPFPRLFRARLGAAPLGAAELSLRSAALVHALIEAPDDRQARSFGVPVKIW